MTDTLSSETASPEDRYHHGNLRPALIMAALSLLTEEQNWSFSLREVARRAAVSHNAPYNHFGSKQELLAAVAAAGFDLLRARMEAAAQADTPAAALRAIGVAYVGFGAENPAHYRLMFGPALASAEGCPPPVVEEAASAAKALLFEVVRRGIEEGVFAVPPSGLELAVLSAWALVHGLTLLLLDGLADRRMEPMTVPAAEQIAGQVAQVLLDGIGIKSG